MNGQRAVWMHPSGYLIQQFEGNWHFEQFNAHSQPVKVCSSYGVCVCERENERVKREELREGRRGRERGREGEKEGGVRDGEIERMRVREREVERES
jgi:hypothetical protein